MDRMVSMAPDLGIAAVHDRYGQGGSPAQVIAQVYERIAEVADPGIFITLRPMSDVTQDAAALPPFDPVRFPLWGIPFAVKDNIDVAGLPTTAACPDFAYDATADAFVVARLRAAGALVIGKTNLDQFATGLVGVRTPYPVPRNALDPAIVPGGSSSGSAVAVAQGIVSFALGTDTAGSGRVPAALNNIVGLKPSLGLLSTSGVVPACRTLDTVSVFSTGVADGWRVLEVAAGYDADDSYARALPAPALDDRPAPVIGVPDPASRIFFGDAEQEAAFEAATQRIAALGAEVRPVDLTPLFDVARMLYDGAWVAERMAAIESLLRDTPGSLHPVTARIVSAAEDLSAVDAFRGFYRLAALKRAAQPILESIDMLCVPTIPTFYTRADLDADPIGPNSNLGTYTNFVNLMDMCGLTAPTVPRGDGRPGSVTLLAPAARDGLLAAFAARMETDAGVTPGAGLRRSAPLQIPAGARPHEFTLAAVGAHMSGLPLNHELTDLGARCLGPARTSADYRLFALTGGAVAKPGLLRVGRDGRPVDVELWALDTAKVGAFMARVQPPLAIGTITLSDGQSCKGFVVEADAVEEARDITSFGGWRHYLRDAAVREGV